MADDFLNFDRTPQPKTAAVHRQRVCHHGPPPGQDFNTLTKLHGRPTGVFEEGRVHPYNATSPKS